MHLLDLEDRQAIGFSDILKISDYLKFNMTPSDIQDLLDSMGNEENSGRKISWEEFNSYMNKKMNKRTKK